MKFIVKPRGFIAANDCRNYNNCSSQCGGKCGTLGSCFSIFK